MRRSTFSPTALPSGNHFIFSKCNRPDRSTSAHIASLFAPIDSMMKHIAFLFHPIASMMKHIVSLLHAIASMMKHIAFLLHHFHSTSEGSGSLFQRSRSLSKRSPKFSRNTRRELFGTSKINHILLKFTGVVRKDIRLSWLYIIEIIRHPL
jgi:hypothetical protein